MDLKRVLCWRRVKRIVRESIAWVYLNFYIIPTRVQSKLLSGKESQIEFFSELVESAEIHILCDLIVRLIDCVNKCHHCHWRIWRLILIKTSFSASRLIVSSRQRSKRIDSVLFFRVHR